MPPRSPQTPDTDSPAADAPAVPLADADSSDHLAAVVKKDAGAGPQAPPPDVTVVQTSSVAAAPAAQSESNTATLDPHPAPFNIYTEICGQIIKEQERIIGVIALEQATHVPGLKVDPLTYRCEITGDGSQVIDDLIEQYRDFFGHAAVEVCKEAASKFLSQIPKGMVPSSLR